MQAEPNKSYTDSSLYKYSLTPGAVQITDDSEMAMCLARALSQHEVSTQLPVDDIAAWYGKWLQSPPFDIGKEASTSTHIVVSHSSMDGSHVYIVDWLVGLVTHRFSLCWLLWLRGICLQCRCITMCHFSTTTACLLVRYVIRGNHTPY